MQGQRLANQQRQIQINQETAYQNGLPTTDGTPNGPIDLNAIARTQIQNGDINGGVGLLSTALKMRLLNDPSNINNPTGQVGGGVSGGAASGGAAPSSVGGFLPAAGGGMIAPAAGGDNYGVLPSGARPVNGAPAGGSGVDPLDVYAHSIGNIESGNNYGALGPKTQSGDRAYGRFR